MGYDPKPDRYCRDYNHFGGEDKGLEYHWYYKLRSNTPDAYLDGRYYSARDWGFGEGRVKPEHNMMTFTEAIKQYNRGCEDGERNAYLILGHVLHLLQDVGDPDHSNLVAHPASGDNEPSAYDKFSVCGVIATAAATAGCGWCLVACPICAAGAYYAAYHGCQGSIDANEVGYEYLVEHKWGKDRADSGIKALGIVEKSDYNSFFRDLSLFSINMAANMGLRSPLGLGPLKYDPAIEGCDPDISPENYETYFTLTDNLAPSIVGYGAGFIRYFYEIVNPPPYVERVVVIRGHTGQTPVGFADFDQKFEKVYDVEWESRFSPGIADEPYRLLRRIKVEHINEPLHSLNNAYIFVVFGPWNSPLKSFKTIRNPTVTLTLSTPIFVGQPFEVKLNHLYDKKIGSYYWGEFKCPLHPNSEQYRLMVDIHGYDNSAHLKTRKPSGDEINSDPSRVAYVDYTSYPTFDFINLGLTHLPELSYNICVILNEK